MLEHDWLLRATQTPPTEQELHERCLAAHTGELTLVRTIRAERERMLKLARESQFATTREYYAGQAQAYANVLATIDPTTGPLGPNDNYGVGVALLKR